MSHMVNVNDLKTDGHLLGYLDFQCMQFLGGGKSLEDINLK